MDQPAKPEGVAVTGWLCTVAGGLTVVCGALFGVAGALARALSRQGTDLLAEAGTAMDPLSRTLLDHFEAVAAVLIVFGLASLVVGVQFLRMRPVARPAMEILAWVILAGTLFLEAAAFAPWNPHGREETGGNWISSPFTSLVLGLLQVLACVLVIRFVRKEAVRTAFRSAPSSNSR